MKKSIIGSFLLAILHSILFYGKDLGVSVILFAIPSVFLLIQLLRKKDLVKNEKAIYLAIPILLLSSTYLIFDNAFFYRLNLVVIPFLLTSMIVWATTNNITIRNLFGKAINLIAGSLEFIPNAVRLMKRLFKIKEKEKETRNSKLKLIFIGILCSIPILCVIIGLLISADGVFAEMFGNLYKKIGYLLTTQAILNLVGRIIIIGFITLYLVCVIYNIVNKNSSYNYSREIKDIFKINIEETIVNTILTVVNIVYLIFSGIQIMYVFFYLFGKVDIGFNLAQYARQGFFQLMFITFINFVLILLTNLNKKEETKNKYTTIMNLLMCVFTVIIALSAIVRMYLYESEFGYTFLRLMVYFILVTELIIMIPTIMYILKGKISLLKSYFVIGTVMYVALNFCNIDYIIAKNNIDRALKSSEGVIVREIDVRYLVNNLGSGATSQMLRLYKHIDNKYDKRRINNYLYRQYTDAQEMQWQEFNISKAYAKSLLKRLNPKYETVNYDYMYDDNVENNNGYNTIQNDTLYNTIQSDNFYNDIRSDISHNTIKGDSIYNTVNTLYNTL